MKKESDVKSYMFALLSHVLPPSPSGQSVVLYRLLKDISPKKYYLISRENYSSSTKNSSMDKLRASYYQLKQFPFSRPFFLPSHVLKLFKLMYLVPWRVSQVISIMNRESCPVLVICTGDIYDILVGCLLLFFKRSVIFYMFDDFANQPHLFPKSIAKKIQYFFLRHAKATIVTNEFLQNIYAKEYGVKSILIHNPILPISLEKRKVKKSYSRKKEYTIIYTGAVYHAHFDAFKNLIEALYQIKKYTITLHIYTFQPKSFLKQHRIYSKNVVVHPHVHQKKITFLQKKADILFLPLAFSSPIPEIIKTSSPGKMGEYLVSNKPILVHAPKDSYISWYFKKFKCGVVVDENNLNLLAQSIIKLIKNSSLRKRIVLNAQRRACQDFGIETAREKFISIINR